MSRKAPLVAAALCIVLAIFYLIEARNYPLGTMIKPGPGVYPMLVGGFLLISSLGTALEAVGGSHAALELDWPTRSGWFRIAAIAAGCVVYLLAFPRLGEAASSAIIIAVTLRVMGTKSWLTLLAVTVVLTLILHYLFVVVLGVPLPLGIWPD